MTGSIQRLGTVLLGLFLVISVALGYWQVVAGPELNADPRNPRRFEEAANVQRGRLLDRVGQPLAVSEWTPHGYVRRYTLPAAVAATGYFSLQYGSTGIEAAYDEQLRGQRSPDLLERLRAELLHRPVVGSDVQLTIDARIQQAAAEALGDAPGAVVALDPRTGAVLALVSAPYFDPNRVDDSWRLLLQDPGRPLFNRALQSTYPPGSTLKTLVAAAAVDLGVVDLNRKFSCTTAIQIGDLSVDCRNHSHLSTVDFAEAYAWSCNRTFALTALGLGMPGPLDLSDTAKRPYPWEERGIAASANQLEDYARRFGFGKPIPFDLPVEASRLRDPGQEYYPSLLAQTGFGQGQVATTPLQMALVAATIANGGVVPAPYLVMEVRSPNGAVRQVHRPGGFLGRAVSTQTAATINRMMELSVEVAYARRAQIPGVKVAGKTGTAEVGQGLTPHSWFIGYAPTDEPRVAVAVIMENRGSGADVATVAAQKVLARGLEVYRPER